MLRSFPFGLLASAISLASLPVFAEVKPTTLINGLQPSGEIKGLVNTKTLIDRELPDGRRVLATRGTRIQGTRVPIHIHEYGGMTCVFSGQITGFVEGMPDKTYYAGDCYYMPPNTPMSAYNSGNIPAVLVDMFHLPYGVKPMKIIERGINNDNIPLD